MSLHEPQVLDQAPESLEPSRRPAVAGAAAGLWSLFVGLALVSCLVMLAWALSPHSDGDTVAAWRAAGYTWLGAHQVPLEIGGRPLTLLPMGGLLLGALLTRRAARWAGQLLPAPSPAEAAGIVAACALVYGAGGAGLAWLSRVASTGADPGPALLCTSSVAVLGATWGLAAEVGLVARIRARVPDRLWRTLIGALVAVIGLFAVGGALVTASLVRHAEQVVATSADLNAGIVGTLALTIVGALSLPTLDVWALSTIVGPGFQMGAGNEVSLFGGQAETLPALPVLATVPATMPGWAPGLLLVPVALGVLAGRIRWGRDLPTVAWTAESAVVLAGIVAVLVGALCLLASGSLGGGLLGAVGPNAPQVAASAAGLVVMGFLLEAALQALRLQWDLHRASGLPRGDVSQGHRDTLVEPDPTTTPSPVPDPTTTLNPDSVPTVGLDDVPPVRIATATPPAGGRSAARRVARAARRSITIPVSVPRPGGRERA